LIAVSECRGRKWTLQIDDLYFILIVVFALNLLGDGLRDAIDPRLRGEE
jgi:ABC-type dipeptide/oligopeptide/nickel transport system permease subunit